MLLFDLIIPRHIGCCDLQANGKSIDDLLQQARTYRNQLDASFNKRQQKFIQRNLKPLKKRIASLEVDHDHFLQAAAARQNEIKNLTGISEEAKAAMQNSAENATVFTIESQGQRTTLNIETILKRKQKICILANQRIIRQNDKFMRLFTRFNYRLSNYLRALNKGAGHQEVDVAMNAKPKVMQPWTFNIPYSSPSEL